MKKRTLVIELEYQSGIWDDYPEDKVWFEEEVLRENRLFLFSPYIGDEIGEVKVIEDITNEA